MSEWIEWNGGECPVDKSCVVEARLSDGSIGVRAAGDLAWLRGSRPSRNIVAYRVIEPSTNETSDGSTASYYELPDGATELQHLISYRDMNAQIGEIFRACYRYGRASHSDRLRDAKKIKFYITAEIERLEKMK